MAMNERQILVLDTFSMTQAGTGVWITISHWRRSICHALLFDGESA